jgi:CubicO group peptidase (beta-lactamase class C family)
MGDTMKKYFAIVLMFSIPAWAAPPAKFEARVEAVRKTAEVPGMAVAIVENGKVTLARGFGVRKLGSPEKVDGDTIFMTGSTGKAMTAAALATLVDAGKLKWDDRVTDLIPGFQMYDPWVTREMTVRDLLVHRSGLASAPAICWSSRAAPCRALKSSGGCALSSPRPASAAATPTTTFSTSLRVT